MRPLRTATLIAATLPAGLLAQTRQTLPSPTARTTFEGRTLDFDFPGLLIGTAEYDEGPTGVTVFYFPNRVNAAVDVRGGAPGTVNTDALRLGYEGRRMSAVVLAGGSWHGLSAVTGAADEIRFRTVDSLTPPVIHGVVGAIVNDLGLGIARRRFSSVTPDYALGRTAVRAAVPGKFYLGARGGGRFAMTGGALGRRETSGQGAAFRQIGQTKIAVFTVVNAAGLVVDRSGQIVRCREMHWGQKCGSANDRLSRTADSVAKRISTTASAANDSPGMPSDNTTISLVVTNQKLPWWALQRLAVQVHNSMARGIQPFATASDGDVLYAVTTDEVDNPGLTAGELGLIASELAWDAILSSVPKADPQVSTISIAVNPATLDDFLGRYELGAGSRMTIARRGNKLVADSANGGSYVASGDDLTPTARDEFLVGGGGHHVIRFTRDSRGRVNGLIINPGNWAVPARRLGAR